MKKRTIPSEKKYADKLMSVYINLRDKYCVTCGTPSPGDASHYITKGGCDLLRWHKDNVHLQCRTCHQSWHYGNCNPYINYLTKKYEYNIFDSFAKLRAMAKEKNWRLTRLELEDIQEQIKSDIIELCEKEYCVDIDSVKQLLNKRKIQIGEIVNYIGGY